MADRHFYDFKIGERLVLEPPESGRRAILRISVRRRNA